MTDKIKDQILAIRDSAVANMIDTRHVQHEAFNRGFFELVLFIEENRGEYVRFILYGDRSLE
jgi:hypothetical protein